MLEYVRVSDPDDKTKNRESLSAELTVMLEDVRVSDPEDEIEKREPLIVVFSSILIDVIVSDPVVRVKSELLEVNVDDMIICALAPDAGLISTV